MQEKTIKSGYSQNIQVSGSELALGTQWCIDRYHENLPLFEGQEPV